MLSGIAKGFLGIFFIAAFAIEAQSAVIVNGGTATATSISHQGGFGDFAQFTFNPQTVPYQDASTYTFTISAPAGFVFSISAPPSGSHTLVFGTGFSGFSAGTPTVVSSQVSFANLTGVQPTGLMDISRATSDGLFVQAQVPVTAPVTFTSITYTVTFQGSYTAANPSVGGWEMGLVYTNPSTPQLLKIQQMTAIPEPSILLLGTAGLVGLGGLRLVRRKTSL